jgi:hypothetical protein
LSELCCLEENILLASNIINDVNVKITPKNFLSVFIIFNCSDDIIGKEHLLENNELIITSKNIIYSETNDEIKMYLEKYVILFNIWKDKDYKIIIHTLCHEYFQTNLSLINISDTNVEKQILLSCYKNKLLNCVNKLTSDQGIYNKVKTYSPLKITYIELDKKYNKIFWETFSEDFDCDNFKSFFDTIELFKNIYISLTDKDNILISAIFNKEYFNDILNNDYSNDDIKFFANKSYDFIKSIQSNKNDDILEQFRFDINSNSTYLPDVIENIMELTKLLIKDIESM